MLVSLLFVHVVSWGPICHAVLADEFAQECFPSLSASQHTAFLCGAIYADGFDKSVTHYTSSIIEHLRQIPDEQSDLYWFFMGLLAHIPPDTFAHAGKSRSFIVSAGTRHHFSELVIDSVMMKRHPIPFYFLPSHISRELRRLNIRPVRIFKILYTLFFLLSKFPLWRIIHRLEKDQCPKATSEQGYCNFVEHYHAMLQSLRESFRRIREEGFTDERVREISTRLVFDLVCCSNGSLASAILSEEGVFELPPLLGSDG
jgi:hypothetical protein